MKVETLVAILTLLIILFYIILGFAIFSKVMKLGAEYRELQEENEKMNKTIQYQKSVIMDLEEYLRRNEKC